MYITLFFQLQNMYTRISSCHILELGTYFISQLMQYVHQFVFRPLIIFLIIFKWRALIYVLLLCTDLCKMCSCTSFLVLFLPKCIPGTCISSFCHICRVGYFFTLHLMQYLHYLEYRPISFFLTIYKWRTLLYAFVVLPVISIYFVLK